MPNEIDHNSSAQRRSSKLLTAMAIFICLGIAAYMVLTAAGEPADPCDT